MSVRKQIKLATGVSLVSIMALAGCGGQNSSLQSPAAPPSYQNAQNAPAGAFPSSQNATLSPALSTEAVKYGIADTALWINKKDANKSLIFATDNDSKDGSLVIYDMTGKAVDHIGSFKGANGVDVQYGFTLGKNKIDVLAVSESASHRVRIFRIDGGKTPLVEITGKSTVFDKSKDKEAEPTALGLYRRDDGNLFAIVSRTAGPKDGYLGEYKLVANGEKVDLQFSRFFGTFSGPKDRPVALPAAEGSAPVAPSAPAGASPANMTPPNGAPTAPTGAASQPDPQGLPTKKQPGDQMVASAPAPAGVPAPRLEMEPATVTIVVDSKSGRVYYGDDKTGYREYRADPDIKQANHELSVFGGVGYQGNHGGITVAKDVILAADARLDSSTLHVYPREAKDATRNESALVNLTATGTNGLEASLRAFGTRFPNGIVLATNAKDKTVQVYDWTDIAKSVNIKL